MGIVMATAPTVVHLVYLEYTGLHCAQYQYRFAAAYADLRNGSRHAGEDLLGVAGAVDVAGAAGAAGDGPEVDAHQGLGQ